MPYSSRRPSGRRGAPRHGRSRSRPTPKPVSIDRYVHTDIKISPQRTYEASRSFQDMELPEQVRDNLRRKGYGAPTEIQDEVFDAARQGRDILGLANTGTGKTAAFLLPLITQLEEDRKRRILIIAPTRELAQQINEEFRVFTERMRLYSTLLVGGMPIYRQKAELKRDPHVLIGTPGRLKDLFEQGELPLERVTNLVLDEADRMLDMGFLPDIRFLLDRVTNDRQILCFSATINRQVEQLLENMLVNPFSVSVVTVQTSEHIDQNVFLSASSEQKYAELVRLISEHEGEKVLVFTRTKHGAQNLARKLSNDKIKADAIHGNKTQPQRARSLAGFKDGRYIVLVATDVAARGLDIPAVGLVVNYDEPEDHETYVHRIGRTGRAGRGGKARTFIDRPS